MIIIRGSFCWHMVHNRILSAVVAVHLIAFDLIRINWSLYFYSLDKIYVALMPPPPKDKNKKGKKEEQLILFSVHLTLVSCFPFYSFFMLKEKEHRLINCRLDLPTSMGRKKLIIDNIRK